MRERLFPSETIFAGANDTSHHADALAQLTQELPRPVLRLVVDRTAVAASYLVRVRITVPNGLAARTDFRAHPGGGGEPSSAGPNGVAAMPSLLSSSLSLLTCSDPCHVVVVFAAALDLL